MKTRRLLILTALGIGLAPLASFGQGSGLIAFWNFNNKSDPAKSVDSVSGIVGVMSGDAKYGAGRSGAASDFGLDVAESPSAELLIEDASAWLNKAGEKDQITVVFWQKNTQDIRNQSAFWFNSPSSGGSERGVQAHTPWSNSNIYFDTAGCCGADTRINGPAPESVDYNNWNHFAFVKNKASKQVWVNGQLAVEGENDAPLPTDFTTAHIGNATGAGQSVPGILDDFGVFAAALTEAQIKQIAGGSSPLDLSDTSDPGNDIPDAIDFGSRPSLSAAQELGFNIRNTGKSKELLISSFKLISGDAANFTVVSFPDKIAPQQSAIAKLSFDHKGTFKRFEVTLETKTNDPDPADKTILTKISATVIGVDSDKDGLTDQEEVATYKTDPFNADSDKDTLSDSAEVKTHKTDPLKADTDGDGFSDAAEVEKKSDPLDPKSDPLGANKYNLLAYWDFNAVSASESKDLIGGVIAVHEGAEQSVDKGGKTGLAGDRALKTNGGRAFVENASFANPAGALNRLTVSFWQKQDEVTNSCAFWFRGDGAGGDRAAQAHTPWSDNNIYWDTSGCCGGATQRVNGAAPDDVSDNTKWNHFAFIKNGDTKEVWVNGEKVITGKNTAKLVTSFTTLSFGSDSGGGGVFQGALDEFAVFGAALAEADIKRLVAGTKPNQLSGGGGNPEPQISGGFRVTEVKVVAAKLRVTFNSASGKAYDVEASDDLKSWTKLSTLNATGGSSFSDIDPGVKFRRFFRVKQN